WASTRITTIDGTARTARPRRDGGWVTSAPMSGEGILSGPIDLDGRRRRPGYPDVEAHPGLVVQHRASGLEGEVVGFEHGGVSVRDRHSGAIRLLRLDSGGFSVDGRAVSLVPPRPAASERRPGRTASGSTAVTGHRARVARAS